MIKTIMIAVCYTVLCQASLPTKKAYHEYNYHRNPHHRGSVDFNAQKEQAKYDQARAINSYGMIKPQKETTTPRIIPGLAKSATAPIAAQPKSKKTKKRV
jgi:hypothetical protein